MIKLLIFLIIANFLLLPSSNKHLFSKLEKKGPVYSTHYLVIRDSFVTDHFEIVNIHLLASLNLRFSFNQFI